MMCYVSSVKWDDKSYSREQQALIAFKPQ